jgi:4'-phosphopantetheinyl transferase EntD
MFVSPSESRIDGILSRRLDEILPSGAVGAVRRIGMEDDQLLSPAESASIGHAVVARRRASGAARMLARSLLGSISRPPPDISWSSSGAPIWPAGVVGSLAHDEVVAAAIVGSAAAFSGLGVDVEPAEPLDDELIPIVATPHEHRAFGDDPLQGKILFCVKEAVFKAVNPFDRRFLAFDDIVVDQVSDLARTSYGRIVRWRAVAQPRVLAVAWW